MTIDAPAPLTADPPTRVRYSVVALCVGMSVLLYLDRFAITPITPTILRELALDKEQFGRAVGAFFLIYALCQVPAGWLSDRFGARGTLALYVVCWSLATIGLGLAGGLFTITVMRMLLGATQAGAYPAAASLLKRWIPAPGRARANTIVAMGGRTGNLLAQFGTPLLTLAAAGALGWQMGGWRAVLVCYGTLGMVWAALFVWLYRDQPSDHPWTNAAERELIAGSRCRPPDGTSHAPGNIPPLKGPAQRSGPTFLLAALTSPELWLISFVGIAVNIGWIFLVTWLPQYLLDRHRSELAAYTDSPDVFAGMLTAVAGLGAMIGGLTGGAAADRFLVAYGRRWGRRLPGVIAGYLVCGMYLVAMQLTDLWWLVAMMILISFTIDFGLGATWAAYQDIGGRNTAVVLGVGNMCGNFGAAGFGWLIGALAKADRWNTVFLIAGLAMALYATGWLFFDATRPVLREDAPSPTGRGQ
jgi:MFS family permease